MPPLDLDRRMKQVYQIGDSAPEKRASDLLDLTGQTGDGVGENLSSLLSLMIWGARQMRQDDLADLILMVELRHGPKEAALKLLGGEDPMPLMAERGPLEAAENLLLTMQDAFLN